MDKGKLCSFAIAGMIGFLSISPITTYAAETKTESVTQSDNLNKNQDRKVVEGKLKQASEKWNTLSAKQKEEVYSLLEEEMKVEGRLMDKLAELGILEQDDAEAMKSRVQERYHKIKESGDFPFIRQKGRK
ncbi:DUF2680 domain-containing protein [Anaerocolumna sp. MB42-C2]|uniref:DUF2680 domain-containing protein n=1 Tax=Anaerocolumna sp. MB42-C2 TaxID=3070997 RepID=UPI0027E09F2A|nr:DUF2680 domain-containing protein [Anaerocolumna sp. MB42-C2]WMJ87665.1 DUF2680 domain-containing protein [Anaerocolumna sp. MB42-C2]